MADDWYPVGKSGRMYIHISSNGIVEAGMVLQDHSVMKIKMPADAIEARFELTLPGVPQHSLYLKRLENGDISRTHRYYGIGRESVFGCSIPHDQDYWLDGD